MSTMVTVSRCSFKELPRVWVHLLQ